MIEYSYKSEKDTLDQFAKIIYNTSGIVFPPNHIKVLDQRIQTSIKEKQCTDIELLNLLQKNPKELYQFIGHITTNHTQFFRSINQFYALDTHILPDLAEKNKTIKHISIWSAGCSSGEEPYTIALYLKHFFEKNHWTDWTFMIQASDIDAVSLQTAIQGTYSISALDQIPQEYYYLLKINPNAGNNVETFTIPQSIKNLIKFQQHNLLNPPFSRNFDIIFCRNVLIYFDQTMQKIVVNYLADALNKDRYLYVGLSETLSDISTKLKPVILPKCIFYHN
ncbi:MAG: CheR family methyltransferase [Brevinemataceae bacterium]